MRTEGHEKALGVVTEVENFQFFHGIPEISGHVIICYG